MSKILKLVEVPCVLDNCPKKSKHHVPEDLAADRELALPCDDHGRWCYQCLTSGRPRKVPAYEFYNPRVAKEDAFVFFVDGEAARALADLYKDDPNANVAKIRDLFRSTDEDVRRITQVCDVPIDELGGYLWDILDRLASAGELQLPCCSSCAKALHAQVMKGRLTPILRSLRDIKLDMIAKARREREKARNDGGLFYTFAEAWKLRRAQKAAVAKGEPIPQPPPQPEPPADESGGQTVVTEGADEAPEGEEAKPGGKRKSRTPPRPRVKKAGKKAPAKEGAARSARK